MARGRKVTYHIDVDETGAVIGAEKVEQSLDDVDRKAGKLDNTSKGLSSRLSSVGAVAAGAAAAGIGLALSSAMSRSISKGREFESQLAELEAITGITGNRLQRLGDRSLELSKKYGTAASDIIEANKLVASQLAEKIDFNTEEGFQQLQQISEQAVVLQKAAGTDLATAVETTTGIINQFNLEASESGRVINNLAAGAKYGAAEVPDIARAMVNAGSAASSANVSLAETNAAIQVLAANGQVGERAGTALRAIFTRLRTESEALAEAGINNVNVESQGLNTTLQKLKPLLDDTAAAKKIFGEEALNQIQILIREAEAHGSLAEKVQGTQTAHEQAAVNMNTFEGASSRLATTFDSELIKAFQESNGAVVQLMNSVAGFVERTGTVIRKINRWADAHSEIRSEVEASEIATESQIKTMNQLRKELVKHTEEGELTAEQENQLREAYEETNESLKDRASTLFDETHALKQRREEVKKQIGDLGSMDDFAGDPTVYKRKLAELNEELEGLNIEISSNEQQLKQYRKALKEGSLSFDEYVQKVREAVEAEKERNEAGEDEKEAESIKTQIKNLQSEYESLINKPDLDAAGLFEAEGIKLRIQELKDLKKERESLTSDSIGSEENLSIDELSKQVGDQNDAATNEVAKQDEKAHEERMKYIDEEKRERLRNEMLIQQQRKAGWEDYVQAVSQGVGNIASLFSAMSQRRIQDLQEEKEQRLENINAELQQENISEQKKQALIEERQQVEEKYQEQIEEQKRKQFKLDKAAKIAQASMNTAMAITKWLGQPWMIGIISAMGAAQISAIAAQPNPYQLGGIAAGPSHEEGGIMGMIGGQPALELEGGEAIINKKATEMFLPELSAINQAGGGVPLAAEGALTLNSVPRDSRPIPSAGGSGVDSGAIAAAVREGMKGVTVYSDIKDIDESDDELQSYKERVGNA